MAAHYQRPAECAETTGEFPQTLQPDLHERRILVLHNRDFQPGDGADDLDSISRADVESSARDVARALCSRGHFVEVKGVDRDDIGELMQQLRQDPPDLVFNLVESLAADARHEILVPGLLDLLGVPYTGSSPLTLGICSRKQHASQILRAAGLSTPEAVLLPATPQPRAADLRAVEPLEYPLFVKLAQEDASLGITAASIVYNDNELIRQVEALRDKYHQPLLIEKFIAGRELHIGLLGGEPARLLPVQELDFSELPPGLPHIITYDSKWNRSSVEYRTRTERAAPMTSSVLGRVEQLAYKSFQTLEVSDYGRCDIRLSKDGTPYVIDVNPNCDLADGAGYARAGLLGGLSYELLIEQIAISALLRKAHARVQSSASPAYRDSA